MKTVAEALAIVLEQASPLSIERVSLAAALGRRLAEEVNCPADVPPFDKSMMDGFALRTADTSTPPATLNLVGEVTAGTVWPGELHIGETLRIMTGAPVPAGADAVIPLERVQDQGETIVITQSPSVGYSILKRGELMRAGERLLAAGTLIRPQEIALLAEIGQSEIAVHRQPSVAVLATGDELVAPHEQPGPGQIRNSNEPMLLAQIARSGARPVGLGIAKDQLEELRDKVAGGLQHDVLLLTGGVSMGSRDLVPQVFASLGIREVFHKVQLKPGKPIWFGIWEGDIDGLPQGDRPSPISTGQHRRLIFGLPGNPVSSMVCFELFVRPAIQRLLGTVETGGTIVGLPLASPHRHREDRPTCFPAQLRWGDNGAEVVPSPWKGSADIKATTVANGLIHLPPGDLTYAAGEIVEFTSWE
ncbi:MAG: molybdopterin molybdotransferase MoeA [Planctomycetaceae bacterium]